jgi:hypothetical protein
MATTHLDNETIRKAIRKEIGPAIKTAVSAAYEAGQHPDKPEARGWAKIAFHRAFDAAEHAALRLKEEVETREAHRRLLTIRDALNQKEAQSYASNYLTWLSAVQFFALHLSVRWPPEPDPERQATIRRRGRTNISEK